MFSLPDVFDLFFDEFSGLSAGCFSFSLVFSGAFYRFFFGHSGSFQIPLDASVIPAGPNVSCTSPGKSDSIPLGDVDAAFNVQSDLEEGPSKERRARLAAAKKNCATCSKIDVVFDSEVVVIES
jgi:hypothetical protein